MGAARFDSAVRGPDSGPTDAGIRRTLILAVVFSLVLNASSLVELTRFGIDSPLLLTNWDEFHYLSHPYNVFDGQPRESFYRDDPKLPAVYSNSIVEPAGVLDILVGAFAVKTGLKPCQLGLLLDLLAPFFAFFLYRRLFLRFRFGSPGAEALAAIFLTLPIGGMLLSIFQPALGAWGPGGKFVTASTGDVDGFSILRSVYTQFSMIGFAWALDALCAVLQAETPRLRDWVRLGVSSGLLIYLYFFSWGAIIAIGGFSVLIDAAVNRRGLSWLSAAACGLGAHLLIAAPGLLILAHNDTPVISDPEIGRYWFVPLEIIPWLLGALLVVRRAPSSRKLAPILFLAAILSYPLLMNLQPLTAKGIAPYRFSNLYLFPLAGITAVISALQFLESRQTTARLLPAVFWVLGVSALIAPLGLAFSQNDALSWARSWIPLEKHIDEHLAPSAVIAVISELPPFGQTAGSSVTSPFPNILSYLTGRHVLHQEWVLRYAVPRREDLERELLDGWLFSGEIQYLRPCRDEHVELPGDLFLSTGAYRELRRRQACRENQDLISNFTPCAGLNKFRPDYILLDRNVIPELPPIVLRHASPDYADRQLKLDLFKLDTDALIAEACSAKES